MTQNARTYSLIILFFILCSACQKEEKDEYGPFWLNIATCLHQDQQQYFLLDNNTLLIPNQPLDAKKRQEGQRVLIQYIYTDNDASGTRHMDVRAINNIYTDYVRRCTTAELNKYTDEPIYLLSVWESGQYLNLKYKVEFNRTPHSLILLCDITRSKQDTLYLHLRHNTNNDPPGLIVSSYASYDLEAITPENKVLAIDINNSNYPRKPYIINLKQ